MISQGDLYEVDFGNYPVRSEANKTRPCVVIQSDNFNHTRLNTTVVCILTSNLDRASIGGNVLLDPGEGDLPYQSVVVVSQVYTIDKKRLDEDACLGRLSRHRVLEIIQGIHVVLEPSLLADEVII